MCFCPNFTIAQSPNSEFLVLISSWDGIQQFDGEFTNVRSMKNQQMRTETPKKNTKNY